MDNIIPVYTVDSSMRISEDFSDGWEWLDPDAYGKLAVMHRGELVTDFIFDCEDNRNWNQIPWGNMIAMIMDGKWGIINSGGNIAIPFIFDHILSIDDNKAFANYKGKYGILNVPLTLANADFKPANFIASATFDYIYWAIALIVLTAIILININKKRSLI